MDRLSEWSAKWLLSFNVAKCKTMHFGRGPVRGDYRITGNILDKSDLEKDLEVFISSDLKPAIHIQRWAQATFILSRW